MLKTKKSYLVLALITAIAMLFAGISTLLGAMRTTESSVFADEYDVDTVTVINGASWASTRYSGFKYFLDGGETIRLSPYEYNGNDEVIHFPNRILVSGTDTYYNVNMIGDFGENNIVRDVYIPSGIETLGDSAFQNCNALRSVHLGKDVKEIIKGALYGNSSVTLKLYIEATATDLGEDLNNFISGLILGLQEKNHALGGLEYVIDGEIGEYNTDYDITDCRPVHIYCDESLINTFSNVFGSANVSLASDEVVPSTLSKSIWELPLALAEKEDLLNLFAGGVMVDFASGDNESFEGFVLMWSWSDELQEDIDYCYYVKAWDELMNLGHEPTEEELPNLVVLAWSSTDGWQSNGAYRTITFADGATAMTQEIGLGMNPQLVDCTEDLLNELELSAEFQGYVVVETPETGVMFDLSIAIGTMVLFGAMLVVLNKKKEQY